MSVKENWLKEDEVCPHCNQVTKRQKGITRQNMKRLVSFRGNSNDWIMTIVIILVLITAYAYKIETKQCREWVKPMFADNGRFCYNICEQRCSEIQAGGPVVNITELKITNKIDG